MQRCAQLLVSFAALAAPAAFAQSSQFVGPVETPASAPGIVVHVPLGNGASGLDGQAVQRKFPQNALRGKMVFLTPSGIELNDKAATLSAAYQVRGPNNLIIMSGQLAGGKFVVDYTVDFQGNVQQIWLLTKAEAKNEPWPRTAAQAAAWTFDPAAQTWTKP